MIKRGLELILDVVEAARVRILSFDAIETPTQAATATHIADLLVQGLVETKKLIDSRVRLSSLSNEKGSRRIQLGTFVPGSDIEIRESTEVTRDESSTIFIGGSALCVQVDADQLFHLGAAILSWFGFEPRPTIDHPDHEVRHAIVMNDAQFKALEALLWECNGKYMLEGSDLSELLNAFMFLDGDAYHPFATKTPHGCVIDLHRVEVKPS